MGAEVDDLVTTLRSVEEIELVTARSAIQFVRTGTADENVTTSATAEDIVSTMAVEQVG